MAAEKVPTYLDKGGSGQGRGASLPAVLGVLLLLLALSSGGQPAYADEAASPEATSSATTQPQPTSTATSDPSATATPSPTASAEPTPTATVVVPSPMPTPTLPPTPIVIDDFCLLASNCGGQGQANHTDAGRAPTRGSGTGQVSLPRTGEGLGPLALLALAAMAAGAGFVLLGARRGPATTNGRALSRSADSSR